LLNLKGSFMKKILKYILVVAFFATISACKEDAFLEKKYVNSIVDINFLTIPTHADQAVIGIYDALGYQGLWKWDRIILGSSSSDEIVEDHGDPGWADLISIDKYRWQPDNKHIWRHWTDNYAGILMANSVIQKVPSIKGMENELTKRYVAEAKALRALFYYNLVTAHGDVPLLTEPIGPDKAKNLTREPAQNVWNLIIKDLTEAETDLPATYSSTNDRGRVTKGFANTMLSTVYLWQKDYTNALNAGIKVKESNLYQLEKSYADLFNGVKEFSSERIFGINCASGIGGDMWNRRKDEGNRNYLWGPYFSWSWFTQPARDFVDRELKAGDIRMDTVILDMRNGETYDKNGDGIITEEDAIPANPPVDCHNMKLVPLHDNLNDGKIWSGDLDYVDIMIMRYAEVELNIAEALVNLNRASEALPYINDIRKRAGLADVVSTDKALLESIILHERMVEFCFEGKRFFDLKRVGKLKEFLGPLGWTDKNVVFPIPQKEIDLTKMKQSEGY